MEALKEETAEEKKFNGSHFARYLTAGRDDKLKKDAKKLKPPTRYHQMNIPLGR